MIDDPNHPQDLLDELLGTAPPRSDALAKLHQARRPGPPPPPQASTIQLAGEAAWYVDPTNSNVMRYWDGEHWTGDVMLVNSPPPPPRPVSTLAGSAVPVRPDGTVRAQGPVDTGDQTPAPPPARPAPPPARKEEELAEFTVLRGPHFVLAASRTWRNTSKPHSTGG